MNNLGLSHIARPGASEERIAGARQRICHCASAFLNREKAVKIIFGPGGPRNSLKRLNSDKDIQGKPSRFLGLFLCGLGPIWLDSAKFGFGLDRAWRNCNTCDK
jgi:hypothetical protein